MGRKVDYCINLEQWNKIEVYNKSKTIPRENVDSYYKNRIDWCNNIGVGRWAYNYYTFYFKSSKDATMFKLIYG